MSNSVTIQRRKVKNLDAGRSWLEAYIFDDYGNTGHVRMEPLPIDALVLFERLIAIQTLNGTKKVIDILHWIFHSKTGITIGNDYVPFESFERLLINYMGFNNDE